VLPGQILLVSSETDRAESACIGTGSPIQTKQKAPAYDTLGPHGTALYLNYESIISLAFFLAFVRVTDQAAESALLVPEPTRPSIRGTINAAEVAGLLAGAGATSWVEAEASCWAA
jgi:hypothetical protein